MIFIETSIFTKEIQHMLSDDSYRMLQASLILRPDAGNLIKGSGGLRKIRWNLPGVGKRGALRIIYYWQPPDTIFMLLPYRKNEQEDLSSDQIKLLHGIVKELLS
jgi:mRNA-degrading endonuclease RelE of RelBE toxin-antitoxin system